MTCEKCGRPHNIGDWPWCPHGKPSGGIQPDTFNASGMWVENLTSHEAGAVPAVWVEGRADLKRKAKERGLKWVPEGVTGRKKVGKPDTDMQGRHNGARFPTMRERHSPAPESPKTCTD